MINTFVFLDLESTGLPTFSNRVRATEICLISVSRSQILNCSSATCIPRILNKISFVINPRSIIPDDVVELTDLSNETLEEESPFNEPKAHLIKLFLQCCVSPICLVAHNGLKFDFPLLKKELTAFSEIVPTDLLCADSLLGFKHLKEDRNSTEFSPIIDQTDVMLFDQVSRIEECISSQCRQEINETTPIAQIINESYRAGENEIFFNRGTVKRKLFADSNQGEPVRTKLKCNYSLNHIYFSLFNERIRDAHRAESDTISLLRCCVKMGLPLVQYFDREATKFRDINVMR